MSLTAVDSVTTPQATGPWQGTVIAIQANYYSVQLSASEADLGLSGIGDKPVLLCIRRGLLKKLNQQIMVGDRVTVEEPDWQGMRGAIA
ncbi:MAG: ribosome small subunit-dependent GTPase, partial [Cyanobacteria bacterium P01_D01_bin.36]